jgi:hypothetical protein
MTPEVAPILEIAHVLFIDIVAYSKLPLNRQTQVIDELKKLVRQSAQYKSAEESHRLVTLPTGDGLALTFFGDALSAVVCSVEIAKALKSNPTFQIRMGVHSGAVYLVEDINGHKNVAGTGINIAQRIMDCGDGGHILISQAVAEVLNQLEEWRERLTYLGEAEVKHDVRLPIYSLVCDEAGSGLVPSKIKLQTEHKETVRHHTPLSFKNRLIVIVIQTVLTLPSLFIMCGFFYILNTESPEFLSSSHGRGFFFVGIGTFILFALQAWVFWGIASNQSFVSTFFYKWKYAALFLNVASMFFYFAYFGIARQFTPGAFFHKSIGLGFMIVVALVALFFYQAHLIRSAWDKPGGST